MPVVEDVPNTDVLEDANTSSLSTNCEISNLEKQSLYYLAGYCAQSLKKQRWACDSCTDCLRRGPDTPRHQFATLLAFRNFKDGALFEVNDPTF